MPCWSACQHGADLKEGELLAGARSLKSDWGADCRAEQNEGGVAEVGKSIASLSNHLTQARVDARKAEKKAKEAEERANKAMDDLKAD